MAYPDITTTAFGRLSSMGVPTMGMAGLPTFTGNVFFVNSVTGADGNTGAANSPMATIDAAIGRCTANNGDGVVCESGHAETLSAASAITCDVAGVQIIGLGAGNDRPTLTFSTATTASIVISAASVALKNFIMVAGINALTNPIHVQAAGAEIDVEWRDGSAIVEAVRAILTTAAADNLVVNLKYVGFPSGSSCVNAVRLVGCSNAVINTDFYGKASTSWVEFLTTVCTGIEVYGYMYNSGTTDGSKDIVDTVTGSTWYANVQDGSSGFTYEGGSGSTFAKSDAAAVTANLTVPTADSTANVYERDVIGNKTDAAVLTVGTTKSLLGYIKGVLTYQLVGTADGAANVSAADVIGNKTDAVLTAVGTTKSIAAYVKTLLQNVGFLADASVTAVGTSSSLMSYIKGLMNRDANFATKTAAVLTNGQTLFTVAGGPIAVEALWSECVTGNDGTASTVQYSATPTAGSPQTLSAASASIASAAAGASVSLIGTALSTAAVYNANGPNLGMSPGGGIIVPAGIITAVIGVGSTTGTWRHYIRFKPLATGVTVS